MPGLEINIFSDPEDIVTSCGEFDRIVDYYQDASDANTSGEIYITLPATTSYV